MSEILFPRATNRVRLQLRLALLALVVLTAFGAAAVALGASFVGITGGETRATARLVTLGDSLGVNSSVKFRGLRVGRVVDVDGTRGADGTYAATVVFQDQYAAQIPASVRARVLPGTLFGAEYVDLVAGRRGSAGTSVRTANAVPLGDGAVIPADTSADSVRLMDTFQAMTRVIGAIDPAAVDMAMSQLAAALDGRGDDLGRFIARADKLVGTFSDAQPALFRDLELLTQDLDVLADIEPDLARAVRDSLPVARTVATHARQLRRLLRVSSHLAAEVSTFLEKQGAHLTEFLQAVAPTYDAFAHGIRPFEQILQRAPAVLQNGARAIKGGAIQMIALMGSERMGTYTPADCPRYGSLAGGNCR